MFNQFEQFFFLEVSCTDEIVSIFVFDRNRSENRKSETNVTSIVSFSVSVWLKFLWKCFGLFLCRKRMSAFR